MPPRIDDTPALTAELQALETELHHPGVSCTQERLEQQLHLDFHEVGRSGRPYTRDTVIRFLAAQTTLPTTESWAFSALPLGPQHALLTYRSAHRETDGSLSLHSFRSSIWRKGSSGWQLFYHQATPAAMESIELKPSGG